MIPCTTLGVIFKSFKEIFRTENSVLIFEQIVKINIAIQNSTHVVVTTFPLPWTKEKGRIIFLSFLRAHKKYSFITCRVKRYTYVLLCAKSTY